MNSNRIIGRASTAPSIFLVEQGKYWSLLSGGLVTVDTHKTELGVFFASLLNVTLVLLSMLII